MLEKKIKAIIREKRDEQEEYRKLSKRDIEKIIQVVQVDYDFGTLDFDNVASHVERARKYIERCRP